MTRILVVDDEPQMLRALTINLRARHYEVVTAATGADALASAAAHLPDLVILDLGLPDLDGVDVVRGLRTWSKIPIIILSGRTDSADKVDALDAGADDYLTKPFALAEVLARLRAIIRRRYQAADNLIRVGSLEIDVGARSVKRGGLAIVLSATEFALLEYLALRQGQVVTRTEIWEHVYDFASSPSSNVIDVYIGYLRKKLDHDQPAKVIHTRRGLGYLLGVEP